MWFQNLVAVLQEQKILWLLFDEEKKDQTLLKAKSIVNTSKPGKPGELLNPSQHRRLLSWCFEFPVQITGTCKGVSSISFCVLGFQSVQFNTMVVSFVWKLRARRGWSPCPREWWVPPSNLPLINWAVPVSLWHSLTFRLRVCDSNEQLRVGWVCVFVTQLKAKQRRLRLSLKAICFYLLSVFRNLERVQIRNRPPEDSFLHTSWWYRLTSGGQTAWLLRLRKKWTKECGHLK